VARGPDAFWLALVGGAGKGRGHAMGRYGRAAPPTARPPHGARRRTPRPWRVGAPGGLVAQHRCIAVWKAPGEQARLLHRREVAGVHEAVLESFDVGVDGGTERNPRQIRQVVGAHASPKRCWHSTLKCGQVRMSVSHSSIQYHCCAALVRWNAARPTLSPLPVRCERKNCSQRFSHPRGSSRPSNVRKESL
jgi:hypothetical protein